MVGRIVAVPWSTLWQFLHRAWKSRVTQVAHWYIRILTWTITKIQLKEMTNLQEASFFLEYVSGDHEACHIHLGKPHSC
jgi:hypothetical protein